MTSNPASVVRCVCENPGARRTPICPVCSPSAASVGPAPDGLLPCPLCCAEAGHQTCFGDHWITCTACGLESSFYQGKAEAIAAWNTRAPHPDREAEPESDGPQLCNVCNGFVPTWGVKVCQCEYHAPAGTHPAEPTGGVVTGIGLDLNDFARLLASTVQEAVRDGKPLTPAAKANVARWLREVSALSVSPPVVEGGLGALRASPCVPTEGHEAAVVAALGHYACACAPGECAMSDDGSNTPVDDVMCGRIAQTALKLIEAARPQATVFSPAHKRRAFDLIRPKESEDGVTDQWPVGSWLSAALDDPSVCEAMKADIHEWFDGGGHRRAAQQQEPGQ